MFEIYTGDAEDWLKMMSDNQFDCCITSPPYYRLRDYGVDDQIGLEHTPSEYISRLVNVFREVRRVLRNDGTLWIVIGDTYTKQKSIMGIPWRLAFALQTDGWVLRQDIIWAKPNPMPESVRDRCTKSHEYIFLLSKSPHYYFNAEAISEPCADATLKRIAQDVTNQTGSDRAYGKLNGNMKALAPRYCGKKYTEAPDEFYRTKSSQLYCNRPRRNKRDVWTITTKPTKLKHFATFPPDLIEPCVLAGSREGGLILDPFCGTGTTGVVAEQFGRNFVGIDINAEYAGMAKKRISETRKEMKKDNG